MPCIAAPVHICSVYRSHIALYFHRCCVPTFPLCPSRITAVHRAALLSVSVSLSQTPVYTARSYCVVCLFTAHLSPVLTEGWPVWLAGYIHTDRFRRASSNWARRRVTKLTDTNALPLIHTAIDSFLYQRFNSSAGRCSRLFTVMYLSLL